MKRLPLKEQVEVNKNMGFIALRLKYNLYKDTSQVMYRFLVSFYGGKHERNSIKQSKNTIKSLGM